MKKHTITLNELEVGMKIAESVYQKSSIGGNILIIGKNGEVDNRVLERLRRNDIKHVEVFLNRPDDLHDKADAYEASKAANRPKVKTVLDDELKKEAIQNINSLFTTLSDEGESLNMTTAYQVLKNFEQVLTNLVSSITVDQDTIIHIQDLQKFDEYTYHHSLSVSVLSIATGQTMGLDPKTLLRLGRCAALHDIGKLLVPISILNKRGKLEPSEFQTIKNHAAMGASLLKSKAYGDTELWSGVMLHHEKANGTGYPRKLFAEEIPIFSRIISICDVYDAVTSYRPYRNPMTPADAYELITSEVGKSFEYDVVKAFFKRLVLYPLNTIVDLSDGKRGIVIENENALRPVVQLLDTEEKIDLSIPKNLSNTIVKVVTNS